MRDADFQGFTLASITDSMNTPACPTQELSATGPISVVDPTLTYPSSRFVDRMSITA
jgi:hypothetical protein